MAYTQADLDAIEAAILSGTSTVSYESKSVTYRSIDELFRIRAAIMRALGLSTTKKTILIAHDRAFE
jgi:hypothetical protein